MTDMFGMACTGFLSSALLTFSLMRLATWAFGGANLMYQAELYGGLLVFIGYVLFDTQVRWGVGNKKKKSWQLQRQSPCVPWCLCCGEMLCGHAPALRSRGYWKAWVRAGDN